MRSKATRTLWRVSRRCSTLVVTWRRVRNCAATPPTTSADMATTMTTSRSVAPDCVFRAIIVQGVQLRLATMVAKVTWVSPWEAWSSPSVSSQAVAVTTA